MTFKKNIANFVTTLRIIGALVILFLKPLRAPFFVVYTLTGATDLLDGFIARRTKTASALGAKLDSIADLLFYTISLAKLLPVLWKLLPRLIWIIVGAILTLRVCAYLVAAFRFRRFASLHTWMNKITGVAVFAVPYFLGMPRYLGTPETVAVIYCFTVCGIGLIASTQELYIHSTSSEYRNTANAQPAKQ